MSHEPWTMPGDGKAKKAYPDFLNDPDAEVTLSYASVAQAQALLSIAKTLMEIRDVMANPILTYEATPAQSAPSVSVTRTELSSIIDNAANEIADELKKEMGV